MRLQDISSANLVSSQGSEVREIYLFWSLNGHGKVAIAVDLAFEGLPFQVHASADWLSLTALDGQPF